MHQIRSYRLVTGQRISISFDEKDLENTIESIIPRIAGESYNPNEYDYRIIVLGKEASANTLIRDHLNDSRMTGTIHFVKSRRLINKWQALYLERYTDMPEEIIKIITSYSASTIYRSRSKFFNSIIQLITHDTKANLSIFFSTCKNALNKYTPRLTATELLQQLHDTDIKHIIDEKGNLTTTAKELIARISENEITRADDQKTAEKEAKQLSDDVLSLISTGIIKKSKTSNCTTDNEPSNCTIS